MKWFRRGIILIMVLLFTCSCLVGAFIFFVSGPKKHSDSDVEYFLQSDEMFFRFARCFFPAPDVFSTIMSEEYKHVKNYNAEYIVFTFPCAPDEYENLLEHLKQDIPRIESLQTDCLTHSLKSNKNVSEDVLWRCYSGYYESESVWMAAMYGTNNTSCELTFVFCFDEELNSVDPLDLARSKYAVEPFH